ncbi:MAG TPA: glycosyltransferase family 1 protein, partial [Acidimicrobiaceae bacterium]|nr:glycosyltransferase family 1 protein [Acidimicrobiaceae bacterium]
MRPHLLVTNDFPPKVGGIQNYLWELWRRLPPDATTVLTTPHAGAAAFDAAAPMRVVRDPNPVLLPHPRLAGRIRTLAAEVGAELVVYDPALPLGAIAPRVGLPYGLVLHGAEITVPARTPVLARRLAKVLRGAELIVSAGGYAAAEATRCAGGGLLTVVVAPGVDTARFVPLTDAQRAAARLRHGLRPDAPLVVGVSRLVPRKGFDRLIRAVAALRRRGGGGAAGGLAGLQLAVVGTGRDARRLRGLARREQVPAVFPGRVPESGLAAVMGMGDVFAMPCRDRWGGLEQEGFGIVFLEAAAAGVAAVAGRSGGSHEAVEHGVTGLVVDRPADPAATADAIARLLDDDVRRAAV